MKLHSQHIEFVEQLQAISALLLEESITDKKENKNGYKVARDNINTAISHLNHVKSSIAEQEV